MFASGLAFNPRSKATNIGVLLSLGAVLWREKMNETEDGRFEDENLDLLLTRK